MLIAQNHYPTAPLFETYAAAQEEKENRLWVLLGDISITEAIQEWLSTLASLATKKTYATSLKRLFDLGVLNPAITLQQFAQMNRNAIVDRIKCMSGWSESTKQARCGAFISFTTFLARRSEGMITKAEPCSEGVNTTFYSIRDKVKTGALTMAEWTDFLTALKKVNYRDYLMAKLMLHGAKRVTQIMTLKIEAIDFAGNTIEYDELKQRGKIVKTVVTYPHTVIKEIWDYLGDRIKNKDGLVFVTKFGNRVYDTQLRDSFNAAAIRSNMPIAVTAHVLRVSAVTYLRKMGASDSDIMKVTGHSSARMVTMYDKTDLADNASKRFNLVT